MATTRQACKSESSGRPTKRFTKRIFRSTAEQKRASIDHARLVDYYRILRKASPWERRHIQGWKDFKGGTAWTMLYGGVPAKIAVKKHGLLDEWPYHISFCQIVSMDASLVLTRGVAGRIEWVKLARPNSKGKPVWSKGGPRGKIQRVYRARNGRNRVTKGFN